MKTKFILAILALSLSIFGLMSCTEENQNSSLSDFGYEKEFKDVSNVAIVNPSEEQGVLHNKFFEYLLDNDVLELMPITEYSTNRSQYFKDLASLCSKVFIDSKLDPTMDENACLDIILNNENAFTYLEESIMQQFGNVGFDLSNALLNSFDLYVLSEIPNSDMYYANKLRDLIARFLDDNLNLNKSFSAFPVYTSEDFINRINMLEQEMLASGRVANDSPLLNCFVSVRYSSLLWDRYIIGDVNFKKSSIKDCFSGESGFASKEELRMAIHKYACYKVALITDLSTISFASIIKSAGAYAAIDGLLEGTSFVSDWYRAWLANMTDTIWGS